MSERDPLWDGLRDLANENHKARIAKTPGRIQYAISQFEKGDRIGQLVIMPVVIPEFTYAESAERGTGAFGSSGR